MNEYQFLFGKPSLLCLWTPLLITVLASVLERKMRKKYYRKESVFGGLERGGYERYVFVGGRSIHKWLTNMFLFIAWVGFFVPWVYAAFWPLVWKYFE